MEAPLSPLRMFRIPLPCLAALALAATAPAAPTAEPVRFDSDLPLEVMVDGLEGRSRVLGTTPSPDGDGVPLPAHGDWWVRPRRELFRDSDWRLLAREIEERGIPGLETRLSTFTPLDAIHFLGVTRLRRLDLGLAHRQAFDLACFRNCAGLDTLAIGQPPRDETGRSLLPRFPRLRRLALPATAEDLADLAPLLELERLDLSRHGLPPGLLRHLPPLPALKELNLDGARVDDRDMAALRAQTSLEVLRLNHCPAISGRGLEQLAGLPRLQVLDLRTWDGVVTCGLCNKVIFRFHDSPNTRLRDRDLKVLARFPALRNLDLHDQPFTKRGVEALREALPDCRVVWN